MTVGKVHWASLLWILMVVLLLSSAFVALRACGTFFSTLDYCSNQVVVSSVVLREENRELLAEREELVRRVNGARQCRIREPEVAEAPSEPEPELASCQPPPSDDILVLVDVSGSMGWDYEADPALTRQYDRLFEQFERERNPLVALGLRSQLGLLEQQLQDPSKINRIDVAKRALAPLVSNIPESARIRLLTFAECARKVRDEGTYSRADSARYQRGLQSIGIRPETALARAIDQLPSMTEAGRSEDRPATIVIVSDGQDSCGGDPCAAAARLKSQLPHSNVSVVSLATAAAANACIARETGGRFLEANEVEQLLLQLRRSVGQLSRDECVALETFDPTEIVTPEINK